MQSDVDALFRLNESVGFRYLQPVDVDTALIKEDSYLEAVFL